MTIKTKKSKTKIHPQEIPSHTDGLKRLNRISGQVEGIKKMIETRRYCPEIITQIRAAKSALKSLEASILETHFHHCIQNTMAIGNVDERKKKIEELIKIFKNSST